MQYEYKKLTEKLTDMERERNILKEDAVDVFKSFMGTKRTWLQKNNYWERAVDIWNAAAYTSIMGANGLTQAVNDTMAVISTPWLISMHTNPVARKAMSEFAVELKNKPQFAAMLGVHLDRYMDNANLRLIMAEEHNNLDTVLGPVLDAAHDITNKLSGTSLVTDLQKTIYSAKTTELVIAAAFKGQAGLGETIQRELARMGFDDELLTRVRTNIEKYAIKENGVYTDLQTSQWDNLTFNEFAAIITREADTGVMSVKAGFVPFALKEGGGKLVGMLKSWMLTSFASTFNRQMQMAKGLGAEAAMLSIGRMMVLSMSGSLRYVVGGVIANRDLDLSPEKLAFEGFQRGGAFPMLDWLNGFADINGFGLGNALGVYNTKFTGQQSTAAAIAGAPVQRFDTLMKGVGKLAQGDFGDKDVRRLATLMPLYNLWYMQWLTSQIQK